VEDGGFLGFRVGVGVGVGDLGFGGGSSLADNLEGGDRWRRQPDGDCGLWAARSGGDGVAGQAVEDLRWAGAGSGGEQWKKRLGRAWRRGGGGGWGGAERRLLAAGRGRWW
jgi:hypothetical protein